MTFVAVPVKNSLKKTIAARVLWPSMWSIYLQYASNQTIVNSIKGSVSQDIWPPFFPWFKPIWAPDKQAKVFLNSVAILLRYSITKLSQRCAAHHGVNLPGVQHTAEIFSDLCWTPRRQLCDRYEIIGSKFQKNLRSVAAVLCNMPRRQTAHCGVKIKSSLVSGCF